MADRAKYDVIAIALFFLVFYAVWSIRATYLYFIDELIPSGLPRTTYSTLVKLLIWCGLGGAFVVLVRRERPLSYCGLTQAISCASFGKCMLMTLAFIGLVIGFETALGGKHLSLAYTFDQFH